MYAHRAYTVEEFVIKLHEVLEEEHLIFGNQIKIYQKVVAPKLGISRRTLNNYIKQAIKAGYLSKYGHGKYYLTQKGRFLIEAGKLAGLGLRVMTGEVAQKGGISPQLAPEKHLISALYNSDLFKGIKMHNIKVQFKIAKFLNGLLLRKDITNDPYFTAQIWEKRGDWYILLHYKQHIWGKTPEEADKNFMQYTFKVIGRLLDKYGISVDLSTLWVKHREWAYQFNLQKIPTIDGIQRFVASLSPHVKSHIDFSEGLLEIETTSDLWAMLFFLQPFIGLLNYSLSLENLKIVNAWTVEIERHLDAINKIAAGFERFNKLLDEWNKRVNKE